MLLGECWLHVHSPLPSFLLPFISSHTGALFRTLRAAVTSLWQLPELVSWAAVSQTFFSYRERGKICQCPGGRWRSGKELGCRMWTCMNICEDGEQDPRCPRRASLTSLGTAVSPSCRLLPMLLLDLALWLCVCVSVFSLGSELLKTKHLFFKWWF